MASISKALVVAALLFVAGIAGAWDQRPPMPVEQCVAHNPWGFPKVQGEIKPLCQQGYFVGYDPAAKLPRFVSYELQPNKAVGCIARSNAFVQNKWVGGPTPDDYAGTGYDKGHMAPAADLSWDQQVEWESYLMTNMSPQAGSLNRGIWKLLESSIRYWVIESNQPYTVYVGSIYGSGDQTIGSGVVVPHAFYKIAVNTVTGQYAGWLFPHRRPYPTLGSDLSRYRAPVEQIQKQAGVAWALPKGATELMPGREWPVDYGALLNEKQKQCKLTGNKN